MAKFNQRPVITITATFSVDESELRALDALAALAGYGDDSFIKHFYAKLGKAYMEDHEAGLRSFLRSVREQVPHHLATLAAAREALKPKGR